MVPDAIDNIVYLANKMRKEHKVTLEYNSKGFKSHMKGADKVNAKYVLLVGEDELQNGTVWLKDLDTKEETVISQKEFLLP